MSDYHIYLHSNEENSMASNTQPKEETMGGVFKPMTVLNKANQFATSGFSSVVNSGVATLTKVLPAVAVGIFALKTADKVLTTGFHHLESYAGNYKYSMEYNNFKTVMGMVMNPVSIATKSLHLMFEQKKFNDKQREYRTLMGDNFIGV